MVKAEIEIRAENVDTKGQYREGINKSRVVKFKINGFGRQGEYQVLKKVQ